jgi:hypothetical protein
MKRYFRNPASTKQKQHLGSTSLLPDWPDSIYSVLPQEQSSRTSNPIYGHNDQKIFTSRYRTQVSDIRIPRSEMLSLLIGELGDFGDQMSLLT